MRYITSLDVTRVLLLDEAQGKTMAETVARLLKEIGQSLAAEHYPVKLCVYSNSLRKCLDLINWIRLVHFLSLSPSLPPRLCLFSPTFSLYEQKLGPLPPTKHLVKSYFESFVWKGKP